MIDYTKVQPDGIFFEGEQEDFVLKGFTEDQIEYIRNARSSLISKMRDCDEKGIKEFKVPYNDCAEAFPA